MTGRVPVTGDQAADRLLDEDPLALVLGMMLDQQVPMEWAFRGPATVRDRLGGRLDAGEIAAMDPDEVAAVFARKPAVHRFPGSMGKRAHALCRHLVDEYDGQTERLWTEASDAADLYRRIRALPGFGEEKARIFLALLAKRFDRAPEGWEEHAGPFADDTPRSVADVDSPAALELVRRFKKSQKAAGKGKAD